MKFRERKARGYAYALGKRYQKIRTCLKETNPEIQQTVKEKLKKIDNIIFEFGAKPDEPETWKIIDQQTLFYLSDIIWEINERIENIFLTIKEYVSDSLILSY